VASDTFSRLDALLGVALRLARSAPSGRIVLAKVANAIDLEWVPLPWGQEIVAALEAAQSDVPAPLDQKRVRQILEKAWGARVSDELDELDADPIAVTALAQVHRAERNGQPVAVKVRRPGLAGAVRQDLALLESLLAPLGSAFPRLDAGAVLREFRERVLDELDLETEAGMQRRFHRALRNHARLYVPSPVTELAHEDVLVSEWIEGVPLERAPDPDQAAADLVLFALGAGPSGLAHADLKPSDVLVMQDGRLAVLDFGAAAAIDRSRVQGMARAVRAFADDDAASFGAALEELGSLPSEHAPTALAFTRAALGELAGTEPARLDSAAVIAARDRALRQTEALLNLIAHGSLPPEDLWPARGSGQLFATIARTGATGRWLELVRDALENGWGEADAP
jgi:predicted unusual protein kinase regulating ubiquinone biosynthesis (AarF/ABC1/UbiB family)